MKRSRLGRGGTWLLAAGLVLLAACNRGAVDPEFPAVLAIEWMNAEGSVVSDRVPEYDFGAVVRGERVSRTMVLRNDGRMPLTLEALAITAGDSSIVAFALDAEGKAFRIGLDPAPEVILVPGDSHHIELVYAPPVDPEAPASVAQEVTLTLTTRGPTPGEETAEITLKGRAVMQQLRLRVENQDRCAQRDDRGLCQDAYLDFGAITPNTVAVRRVVTFENLGTGAVELSGIGVNANRDLFTIETGEGADPTRLTIPGRSEGSEEPGLATLTVTFEPRTLGVAGTILLAEVTVAGGASQSRLSIQIRGFGGGPHLETGPSERMDFGQVAWFPEAALPSSQARRLVIRNVGSSTGEGGGDDRLQLGKLQSDGTRGAPYFEIVSGEGTGAGEFTIELEGSLPEGGLPAVAGENSIFASVRFTPAGLGARQAVLRIYSNDPGTPVRELSLAAEAVDLPPCVGRLTPSAVDFGMMGAGTTGDRLIEFVNDGISEEQVCLVSNLRLAAGSAPVFRLPEYPSGSYEVTTLPAGSTFKFVVRATAGSSGGGMMGVTGAVELSVSSPTAPELSVKLEAQVP